MPFTEPKVLVASFNYQFGIYYKLHILPIFTGVYQIGNEDR